MVGRDGNKGAGVFRIGSLRSLESSTDGVQKPRSMQSLESSRVSRAMSASGRVSSMDTDELAQDLASDAATCQPTAPDTFWGRADSFFSVSARGSTFAREMRAGFIAFLTMSYILAVNPAILGKASYPGNIFAQRSILTATTLSAALGSLAMGLLGRVPLAVMPGMGLNAYFAFSFCQSAGIPWQEALSCCLVCGALLVVLGGLGVCDFVASWLLSDHLKKAITVAIGLFQAFIGFQEMGLVAESPRTLVMLGDFSISNGTLYLAIGGFCFIIVMTVATPLPGAMLVGMMLMSAIAWAFGLSALPDAVVSVPTIDTAFSVSFAGWHPQSGKLGVMFLATLVFLFVAVFDMAGVQHGLLGLAGLQGQGSGQAGGRARNFVSAGLATMAGAVLGTSPCIIATETCAGIVEGGRTGVMSIVVAILFLLSTFFAPVLTSLPQAATAVPMVVIGAFMMSPAKDIDWNCTRVAFPAFITITVVPQTYSIHGGIVAGILVDKLLWFAERVFANTDKTCVLEGTPEPAEDSVNPGSPVELPA